MATSYSNPGGMGDRQGSIYLSSSPSPSATLENLIDGLFGANSSDATWWTTGAASGRYIRFDFGAPRVIDEAKWYQSSATAVGTWKWQGSNDGSTWTDIGASFTLGGATTQTQTELNGNSTAYRYYQLLGVSGTYSDTPYILEIEFKIDEAPATSYNNPQGRGNRTANIFVSSSETPSGGSNANLVNGNFNANSGGAVWYSTGSASGRWIKFNFSTPRLITEATWYQSDATAHGTWKWQGSNDDSSWTDIGSSFTLGGATTNVFTQLNGNVTKYKIYRLLGVSGTYSNSPFITEIEFAIDEPTYPTVRSVSTNTTSSATSLNVTKPAGTVEGDLLIAFMVANRAATSITPPSGWTSAFLEVGTANRTYAIYYKVAGPSEPANYTFTIDVTGGIAIGMARVSGIDQLDPIEDVQYTNSDSTHTVTAPSLTTTVDGCLIFRSAFQSWNGTYGAWSDTALVELWDIRHSSVGNNLGGTVSTAQGTQLTAGATGTASATNTDASYWSGVTLAVKPATADAHISSIAPDEGSERGGTSVTITGSGFSDATGVLFDTDAADDFVVVSDTEITCTTPEHAPGLVDVTVERPSGDLVATDAFTFLEVIYDVVPASGNIAGGTPVTIYGEGFVDDDADGVLFDTDPADDFVVVNDTTITCTTPAHASGLVDVTITFDVEPDVVLEDAYEYVEAEAPEIISVVPDNGTMHGGTSVTITGENFTDASSVTFGSEEADDLVVVNDTTITVTTPEHEPGLVDVTVTTPAGSDTLEDGFEFRPPARITQTPLLVIHEPNQSAHVTQIPLLVINLPIQGAKITQTPVLPVWTPTPIPLPLPVLPDVPIVETWEYRTVVTISDRSKEQRSQLRAEPRFNMSFSVTILDDEDRRDVYQMLMKYISSTFSYPMFVYAVKLDSETLVGNSKLFFNPAHTDMRPGEGIVLYNPQTEEMVVKTIQSVESDGAILTEPIEFEVPAWYHVAPAPTFRTAPTVGFQMDSISGSLSLQLHGVYSRAVMRPSQSTGLLTLVDGLLLLDKRPLANGAVDEEFDQNVEWLDNGVAPPEPRTNWYSPFIGGKRSYLVHRPNDLDYWRAVANYLKGRQNPFLLPTFRNDMPLAVTPSLGATTIVSSNIQFAEFWRSRAWRYLSIQSDAGILYRRINEVITNYDMNGQPISVSIKLASSIGSEAGRNQNMVVSFVNTCRLDGDDIVLEHGYVDTTLTMKIRLVEE